MVVSKKDSLCELHIGVGNIKPKRKFEDGYDEQRKILVFRMETGYSFKNKVVMHGRK